MSLCHPVVTHCICSRILKDKGFSISSDFSRFELESLAIIRVSEYMKERK